MKSDEKLAADDWVIVGDCWAPTALRQSELKEFQRGIRDVLAWGLGFSALAIMAVMILG